MTVEREACHVLVSKRAKISFIIRFLLLEFRSLLSKQGVLIVSVGISVRPSVSAAKR